MAVTVGTDTYLSVADADTYWSNRNNSTWDGASTAEKEKALREATQYIDGAYQFIGVITSSSQLLAWPRAGAVILRGNMAGAVFDSDEYPPQVKNACAELALECLSARLVPAAERGGAIKSEKVDSLQVEYQDWAPSRKTYDFVTMLLKPVLKSGGGNRVNLVRS